jgi:hypothetical protein
MVYLYDDDDDDDMEDEDGRRRRAGLHLPQLQLVPQEQLVPHLQPSCSATVPSSSTISTRLSV